MVDTVEPLVHYFETRMNGDKLSVNSNKPSIECLEASVYGLKAPINCLEAFVLRSKTQVHLGKAPVNQLCMLAKVLFESFASHRSFEKCHTFVE